MEPATWRLRTQLASNLETKDFDVTYRTPSPERPAICQRIDAETLEKINKQVKFQLNQAGNGRSSVPTRPISLFSRFRNFLLTMRKRMQPIKEAVATARRFQPAETP